MRDKTATDQFFVLSLFAIAKEIITAGKYVENDLTEVRLNIGLPPSHYSALYQKYEDYFKKPDIVDFTHNGKPYSIYITEVTAYPQAYAAAMTVYSLIKEQPKALVLDIGGFTADYLMLKDGRPDLSLCDSLENGVIILYNSIRSKINADYDILLDESDIDAILLHKSHGFPQEIVTMVRRMAESFVDQLFGKLRERMIDLRVGKTIFIGGVSILLREFIGSSKKLGGAIIIDDIAANAKGNDILYRASHRR